MCCAMNPTVERVEHNGREANAHTHTCFFFFPPSHQSAHDHFHNRARYARSACISPTLSHVITPRWPEVTQRPPRTTVPTGHLCMHQSFHFSYSTWPYSLE
ncbi:unnamed protein product [Ectocarpus sp. 12 AP-2014]